MLSADSFLFPNELHGITSDLLSVQHMKAPEPVDRLAGKAAQGKGDQPSMEGFYNLPPACSGRNRRDEHDMGFSGMPCGGGNQAFFQRLREAEGRVVPDIGNRPWWKEKERPSIARLSDAGPDHLVLERARVKAEGRFFFMLGIPRGVPGIDRRVGRGIEQKDDGLDIAPGRRNLSDVDLRFNRRVMC